MQRRVILDRRNRPIAVEVRGPSDRLRRALARRELNEALGRGLRPAPVETPAPVEVPA